MMKSIDREALSTCDGKDGRPVYIAHRGRVFDVSESKLWRGGLHMKRHHAGGDLTTDLSAAPHGEEMLDRYPQIGVMAEKPAEVEIRMPAPLARALKVYPFLRRHPHPMTVHFPIVFMFSATVFTLLYLATGVASFETTAFHCLGGGVVFGLVAIGTGWYTWWLNYLSRPVRAVKIKKRLSPVMVLTALVAFIWRCVNPQILSSFDGVHSRIYLVLVLSLFPMVTVIGWFGAQLTFPIEEE
jgi:predicted heme/steroid binding protein/uncharacterized membrane protein